MPLGLAVASRFGNGVADGDKVPTEGRRDDLRRYMENAGSSLSNYGERYCFQLPISTSRAEGCVDEINNARMAKKQRMRWSPRGAHRIAVVRATVLDDRFGPPLDFPLAA